MTNSPGFETQYGSFVPTPGYLSPAPDAEDSNPFELPAPALKEALSTSVPPGYSSRRWKGSLAHAGTWASSLLRTHSTGVDIPNGLRAEPTTGPGPAPGATPTTVATATPSPHPLQRLFSTTSIRVRPGRSPADISLQNLDLVREKQQEFYNFLDAELEKVEKFYRFKEDQAGKRLEVLREQLREMRNRRIHEIANAKAKAKSRSKVASDEEGKDLLLGINGSKWINPLKSKMVRPGPNSKALQKMAQTPVVGPQSADARRDYIRRPDDRVVPYRSAKRKLKLALQEFYRSLELLKSYALLNRTAFRKLNKKYDKAVRARPPYRYLNEKVNNSYFVTSDVLDTYIQTVEDLYARYFEKGNRKIAAGKLRSLTRPRGNKSGSAFRCGILIGTGLVFSVQGLSFGVKLLLDEDTGFTLRQQTSYLLQIYAGYFLMLYLFLLFCLDCRFWHKYKINYPFIFEFDPRHQLDWKQLSEFPSFFLFVFGIFMWLNFSQYGSPNMYLYYPVVMIFASVAIIFMPLRTFMLKSRNWFVYSHVRFYPFATTGLRRDCDC